jgi:hypothetical protein
MSDVDKTLVQQFRGRIVESAAERGVYAAQAVFEVHDSHADRRVFKRLAKAVVASAIHRLRIAT